MLEDNIIIVPGGRGFYDGSPWINSLASKVGLVMQEERSVWHWEKYWTSSQERMVLAQGLDLPLTSYDSQNSFTIMDFSYSVK